MTRRTPTGRRVAPPSRGRCLLDRRDGLSAGRVRAERRRRGGLARFLHRRDQARRRGPLEGGARALRPIPPAQGGPHHPLQPRRRAEGDRALGRRAQQLSRVPRRASGGGDGALHRARAGSHHGARGEHRAVDHPGRAYPIEGLTLAIDGQPVPPELDAGDARSIPAPTRSSRRPPAFSDHGRFSVAAGKEASVALTLARGSPPWPEPAASGRWADSPAALDPAAERPRLPAGAPLRPDGPGRGALRRRRDRGSRGSGRGEPRADARRRGRERRAGQGDRGRRDGQPGDRDRRRGARHVAGAGPLHPTAGRGEHLGEGLRARACASDRRGRCRGCAAGTESAWSTS